MNDKSEVLVVHFGNYFLKTFSKSTNLFTKQTVHITHNSEIPHLVVYPTDMETCIHQRT